MSGIHLPDIGKLGIHIATGMKDKKKVAPSNMAENARFQALSVRLDTEKHERTRVLKKEERRMQRKQHKIDKRWHDIQRNKKQELSACVDSQNGKAKFPPLICYPNKPDGSNDELNEESKDLDQYSSSNCSPTSAIFPIQDNFRVFESRQNRASEKRKLILPPIETERADCKTKQRKSTPFKKKPKKNNIMKRKHSRGIYEQDCQRVSELENSKVRTASPLQSKHQALSPDGFISTENEVKKEVKFSSLAPEEEIRALKEEVPYHTDDEATSLQLEDGTDLSVDETNSSANPFNYLLIEAQRRKALHQNLEDAFRAIQACRYIRTPSQTKREDSVE